MAPQKNASKKKQFHGKPQSSYYSSKRPVGGKGIFITTVRGKESRCAGEAYDVLDEIADQLYPPERIQEMQDKRAKWLQERAEKGQDQGATATPDDDDDDDDEVVEQETVAPATATAADSDSDDDDDLDLEASIQKELAALKAGHGGQVAPTKARKPSQQQGGAGGDKAQARRERPRFQSIQTDTECLCFIATAWPYDPVELTEAIVAQVQETGQSRTRFVQRLTPTTFTCHSLSLDQVEAQSARLIEQTFVDWATANNKTSITYAIEPSVRSHQAPLSRSVLLSLLGSQITKLSSPPTVSSPCPTRPLYQVRADLKNPDLVLLPTVLRNMYGLSIVQGKLWRGKKFNVAEIAAGKRSEAAQAAKGEGAADKAGEQQEQEQAQSVVAGVKRKAVDEADAASKSVA